MTGRRMKRDLLAEARQYQTENARRVLVTIVLSVVAGYVLADALMRAPARWWISQ